LCPYFQTPILRLLIQNIFHLTMPRSLTE